MPKGKGYGKAVAKIPKQAKGRGEIAKVHKKGSKSNKAIGSTPKTECGY